METITVLMKYEIFSAKVVIGHSGLENVYSRKGNCSQAFWTRKITDNFLFKEMSKELKLAVLKNK